MSSLGNYRKFFYDKDYLLKEAMGMVTGCMHFRSHDYCPDAGLARDL